MQWGQNRGVTFPSPFNSTVLSAFSKFEQNATLVSPQCSTELNKNGCANHMASSSSHVASSGLKYSHCTFTLPMAWYCDLPVEDVHWLNLELSLEFHLNHIPIYHMVRIMYISLKQRNMKNIMSSSASRQCKSIATSPIISSTSNGSQYLGDSLEQLPIFKALFLSLTLR